MGWFKSLTRGKIGTAWHQLQRTGGFRFVDYTAGLGGFTLAQKARKKFENSTSIGRRFKSLYRGLGAGATPVSSATGVALTSPYGVTGSIVGKY